MIYIIRKYPQKNIKFSNKYFEPNYGILIGAAISIAASMNPKIHSQTLELLEQNTNKLNKIYQTITGRPVDSSGIRGV